MECIQRKHQSHFTTWHTSLLLLLFIVRFEKIAAVASSTNNQLQKAQSSSLLLTPGPDSIFVSWPPAGQENGTVGGSRLYSVAWIMVGKKEGGKKKGDRREDGREELTLRGLKECTTYDVIVITNDGNGTSLKNRTTTLIKEPPVVLRLSPHNITARSLALSWERPTTACEITAYNITASGVAKWGPRTEHTGSKTICHRDANSVTSDTIDGLQPYTDYTIRVAAYTEAGVGKWTFINATTLEGVPSKPTNLTTSSGAWKTIIATWREPKESNGDLGRYNISWYGGNQTVYTLVTYPTHTIEGLSPCVEYRLRVAATTEAGAGEYQEVTQITGGVPLAREVTCSRDSQSQSVTVTWKKHDPYCPITGYDVVDQIANTTVTTNSSTVQHTLNVSSNKNLSHICVASKRMAGVRGEWACCKDIRPKDALYSGATSQKTVTIAVGAAAGAVALVLLGIIHVCKLWRRSADRASTDDHYYTKLIATVRAGVESLKHPAAAEGHFENLIQESHVSDITVAQRTANKKKNLYSNVLPFDSNRVPLKRFRSSSTDYINASFVKSPIEGDVSFIACQSPKNSTVDDFWWMVWEQNVSTIVMLVRSDDPEKTKSIQYWPGPGEEVCTSFSITIVKKEIDYTLVKRKIQLTRLREKRTLHHFQLISWPEFGVPNSENELLMLMKDVREHVGRCRRHHVVVHCSAGVGQTGTFIGLWQLQVQSDLMLPNISVRDTVLEMRRQRQMMVQRPVQYQFLHVCFLAYLQDMQIWRPGSGHSMSTRRRRSTNKRPIEAKESSQGTELNLLPQHPNFGPLPPLPPSATSDDYATKNELDTDNPYYYPDISDEMKEEILSGT